MRAYRFAAFGLLVAGCAPTTQEVQIAPEVLEEELAHQKQIAINHYVGEIKRLHSLSYDLLIHGAPLCGEDVSRELGIAAYGAVSFPEVMREAVDEMLDLADGKIRVSYVMPDSPADRAGIEVDDEVVELNGVRYAKTVDSLGREQTAFPQIKEDGSINELVYKRDGVEYTVELESMEGCDYTVALVFNDQVNAFADGSNIIVYTGLMRTFEDEMVRHVVAHELAHNAMKHIDAKIANTSIGLVVDLAVIIATGIDPLTRTFGSLAYSQEFEAEADYVGQYLLARAGYDPGQADDLWRQMTVLSPYSVFESTGYFHTHPDNASRHLSLAKHAEEIKEKIANGDELVPNLK